MRSYGYGDISWMDKSVAQLIATTLLWTLVWIAFLGMIITDSTVFNVKQWYVLLVVLFGWEYDGCQVGLLCRCAIPWLHYFSPSFHPCMHIYFVLFVMSCMCWYDITSLS
jgi:hypothetical protein